MFRSERGLLPGLRTALTAALAMGTLGVPASRGQLPAPPASLEDALHQMLDQSGVVFTGQVMAIRRVGAVIEIDFAVDDAVLGTAPGTVYTLREWVRLAANADSTFVIGRRYLMFLHAPGPGGLSSPVGGPDGAIPILPGNDAASPTAPDAAGLAAQAQILLTASAAGGASSVVARTPGHTNFRLTPGSSQAASPAAVAVSSALASSTIDLRWIATRILTPVTYTADGSPPAPAGPVITNGHVIAGVVESRSGAAYPATVESVAGDSPAASPLVPTNDSYSTVLAALRSWQEIDRAAR